VLQEETMLHVHSALWHYLFLAPNILALMLVVCVWRTPVRKNHPFFVAYLLFLAFEQFCLYWMDLSPMFSAVTWWKAFWVGAIIEALLKFAVIAELLRRLLHPWPSIAKVGRNLITGAGVVLVFTAAIAAAYAAPDNVHWLVSGGHVLEQTIYLAAAGLILSIFAFAAYFRIPWDRTAFGIALGYGMVWCQHLAIWALISGGIVRYRDWLDFANMSTFHLCVLVWIYYLVPAKQEVPAAASVLPENSLDIWNRELEHLLGRRSEPVKRELERLL
jgi:hypothetical protein